MNRRGLFALLLVGLLFAGLAMPALAHDRSRSHSQWVVRDDMVVGELYLDARQATLFLAAIPAGMTLAQAYRQRLEDGLSVWRGGLACRLAEPAGVALVTGGRLRGITRWQCEPGAGALEIRVEVFTPLSANHVHFLRLDWDGTGELERVLTRGHTRARFEPDSVAGGYWSGFAAYLRLGAEHLLGGADHLAFLAGLILLVRSWRRLVAVTLGFTLGHSATLALAAAGLIAPPGAAIEALIGFSILFVAADAAVPTPSRRSAWIGGGLVAGLGITSLVTGGALTTPIWLGLGVLTTAYFAWSARGGDTIAAAPLVSSGFGLVHGVGFAGALLAVDPGRDHVLPALLGFNLGLELAQLAVIAATLFILTPVLARMNGAWRQRGQAVTVALLAALGTFWFISRAFG